MEARAQYLSSRAAGQSQVLVRLTRMTSTPYRVGSVNADVQQVPVQHHIMATQR
jgi:hypothetical protein